MSFFSICCFHGVSLEMQWIPRSENENADYLSRLYESDDWGISRPTFEYIDNMWGPHSIDRFANHLNTSWLGLTPVIGIPVPKTLTPLSLTGLGKNNYSCPPVCLFLVFYSTCVIAELLEL